MLLQWTLEMCLLIYMSVVRVTLIQSSTLPLGSSQAGESVRCAQSEENSQKARAHLHKWKSQKQFDLRLAAAHSIRGSVQ